MQEDGIWEQGWDSVDFAYDTAASRLRAPESEDPRNQLGVNVGVYANRKKTHRELAVETSQMSI